MTGDPCPKRSVQLLATAIDVSPDGSRGDRVFAQILELGEKGIVLESARALVAGERLELGFFLPLGRRFERVSLVCQVERLVDEEELIFAAGIHEIDGASQRALAAYVAGSNEEGG